MGLVGANASVRVECFERALEELSTGRQLVLRSEEELCERRMKSEGAQPSGEAGRR